MEIDTTKTAHLHVSFLKRHPTCKDSISEHRERLTYRASL
ncbi:hypothetical protein B4096_1756 [Heyndrickxia coagulans]|nr:hypothetical protein B4096_1756 [Heyndrickxia coagulans]